MDICTFSTLILLAKYQEINKVLAAVSIIEGTIPLSP
jgi:hypothetical protein